ncbi:MAG TPA: histidine kinase [Actinophytocola sp.]|uniref:sensor histidine kinase n=1 Tax=Actinophytocola sp. TaxID=1872138 RepID=UPI002F92C175
MTRSNTDTQTGAGAARGSAGPAAERWAGMRAEMKRDGWSWPEDNLEPSTRAGRFVGTVVPALFLIYLTEPVRQVFGEPHPVAIRVLVPAVVVVYAVTYMYAMLAERKTSHLVRAVTFSVMTVCGLTIAAILGPDDLVYMTYAISMALVQLPPLVGLIFGVVVTAALLIGTTISDGTPNLGSASVLIVLTVALFGIRQVIRSNAELRAARDEIATLAVAEERARLARDLHDVLGHSLTTITVKAGLARRLLESSGSVTPAVAELRDVEHLSRTALAEVRATVSGYRKASLPAELVGARAALAAAEIEADLPHAVDNVPAQLQEPFAYVLREGVTNVIRHSGARSCSVRLGDSWIEIRDDGAAAGSPGVGHGLAGLTERLEQVGGSLEAGPCPEGGFRLRATVPAQVAVRR